jgi:hypothetical protein
MTTEDFNRARNIAIQLLPATGGISEELITSAVDQTMKILELSVQERDQLIRELQAAYTVTAGEADALDGGGDHVEWLSERRSDIDWKLWIRYMRYLQESKGFPPLIVNRLDDVTDQILQRLEDPKRSGSWDRRGMVVGHVQSGKTANYTGVICKAADAGYKVIVVLAGLDDSLRSQTQLRLDEGVLGFDTQQRRNFDQANTRIGVGALLPIADLLPAHSLTSSAQKGDFSKKVARQIAVNPGGTDPLVLVVKKNKSILNNLISWITSFDGRLREGSDRAIVHNVPLLVIDDECDHASVNTNVDDPDRDPTAINRCIRTLLASFDQTAYIGYTATPFANIFIAPESTAVDKHGEDLFPRDFIVSLKKPSDYVGASKVFGLDGDAGIGVESVEALPTTRSISDYEDWVPSAHKSTHVVQGEMPYSLRKALLSFALVCAARRARGQGSEHNSMLVHVTRFTNVQEQVAEQVEEELGFIKQRIKYGDGDRSPTLRAELRELWEADFRSTTEAIGDPSTPYLAWEELAEHLEPAITKIEVRTVNGLSIEALEYFGKPAGISVIAIGGAKLSRGLTLEGLSVSYYLRTSRMYDTLLQMGRWFGFRPGYTDLCRLFTTAELQRWYREIALANEDLLIQFEEMALSGGTPSDFGLRVRQSADGLVVTAAGKMRHGTKMKLSFSGDISETIKFETDDSRIDANFEAVQDLVRRLDAISDVSVLPPAGDQPSLAWSGISGELVADFLEEFQTHPLATKAQSAVMAKYIRGRLRADHPELTDWTVALMSNSGRKVAIGNRVIGRTIRARFPETDDSKDVYGIRRLLSPGDELLDLSKEELETAQALTDAWWAEGRIKSKSGVAPSKPNGRAVRMARPASRGLLIIYALVDRAEDGLEQQAPVMGLAVSFPQSAGAGAEAIDYVVNNVYSQLELETE